MKKSVLLSAITIASAIGYTWHKKKHHAHSDFRFSFIKKKLENSGYALSKTKTKGVYLMNKNGFSSLFIYDNSEITKKTLFSLLESYQGELTPHVYLVSDSPNTLYAKTKTYFYRWASNYHGSDRPTLVHFSTVQEFKQHDEPFWETVQI